MSDAGLMREFVASYGFRVNTAEMTRAEAAQKAAEDRISTSNAAAVNKMVSDEKKAQAQRIANAIKAGEQLSKDDRAFVLAQERERVDAADREKKRQLEAGKRTQEDNKKAQAARDENFKRTEQQFLRLASAAVKFTAALDVAKVLDQLTFGSFGKLSGAAFDLERMKYVGDSAGTSVKGLQAFGFAASQLGQSADAAEADLKRFGDQIKTFPGYEEQIKSLGVATRDMNGHLRDAADIAKDLGPIFETMPRATREAYASAQGFGEATLQAMIRPGFGGYYGQALADQARIGADPNAAGAQASEFMRSLRHLNEVLHDVAVRIQTAIFPLIKPALDQITAWLLEHSAAISGAVEKITKGVGDVAAAFIKSGLVKEAIDSLNEGIETFAGYINSGDFRKDLKTFVADIKSVASAVRWALEKLGILPSTAASPVVSEPQGASDEVGAGGASLRNRRGGQGHQDTDTDVVHGRLDNFRHGRGIGSGANPEVADYIAHAAAARGIDPRVALAVAGTEGLNVFDPNKPDGGGDKGTSFGPWQFHYKSDVPGFTNTGMGNDFDRDTGLNGKDPKNWKAQTDYALDFAKKHGWGNWHGWQGDKRAGLGLDSAEAAKLVPQRPAPVAPPTTSGSDPTGQIAGDLSGQATYSDGQLGQVKGFIVHHTAGRGTPEGVVGTLKRRKSRHRADATAAPAVPQSLAVPRGWSLCFRRPLLARVPHRASVARIMSSPSSDAS